MQKQQNITIFRSFKPFNLKWTRPQICLFPCISTSSVKIRRYKSLQKKAFFHFPFLQFLSLAHLTHTSVMLWMCGTHEKRGSGETDMKEWTHFLKTVRYFNSSRGVIQCLNKLGGITMITSSCFCLRSPLSTLFGTVSHLKFYLLAKIFLNF